jgi:hypothetical protein
MQPSNATSTPLRSPPAVARPFFSEKERALLSVVARPCNYVSSARVRARAAKEPEGDLHRVMLAQFDARVANGEMLIFYSIANRLYIAPPSIVLAAGEYTEL